MPVTLIRDTVTAPKIKVTRLEMKDEQGNKQVLTRAAAIRDAIRVMKSDRDGWYVIKRNGSSSTTQTNKGKDRTSIHSHQHTGAPNPKETAAVAEYVQSLKDAEGGAWSTAEFVQRAGISRQALQERRDSFTIVYWTDAKRHCHYPKWQFDSNLQVNRYVRDILALLSTHDTLKVLTTFLVPSIGEPGVSALRLIQSGQGEKAFEYVRAITDEH
ncbi:MAG: hypothetical protein ABIZ04_21175 [Opitutus sp.]